MSLTVTIDDVGILTRDRCDQLKRCVVSYTLHLHKYGRRARLTICDASESSSAESLFKAWLASNQNSLGSSITYYGRQETQNFIVALNKRGVPKRLTDFALWGCPFFRSTPGANRNTMLLRLSGRPFLTVDDDSMCPPRCFRSGAQDLKLLKLDTANIDTHFFRSHKEAIAAGPGPEADLLEAHEQLLEQPLNDRYVSSSAIDGSSLRPTPYDSSGFQRRRDGAVAVTMSGVLGDSGVPTMLTFLLAPDPIRARFDRFLSSQALNRVHRSVVRGVCRPSITQHQVVFTTTATALDNSRLLPPFSPSGLGEDTVFGLLLGQLAPGLYTGHVPMGLIHSPARNRVYSPPPTSPSLNQLLAISLGEWSGCEESDQLKRISLLSSYLYELSDTDDVTFQHYLHRLIRKCRTVWINSALYSLENSHSRSAAWILIMNTWLNALERLLPSNEVKLTDVIQAPRTSHETAALVKAYYANFAYLLRHWAELVRVAATCSRGE